LDLRRKRADGADDVSRVQCVCHRHMRSQRKRSTGVFS
jgi:hypothetical protein